MTKQKGLLLVVPMALRANGDQMLFESQACNGLERWADNFESVVVAAPLMPPEVEEWEKAVTWRDTATLANPDRFEIVPLPRSTSLLNFLSDYKSVRASLAALISRCRHLQFAIGGLSGDWAAIAALEAHKQGRPYAIHTDRVEHEVMLQLVKEAGLSTRIKVGITAALMASYHRWIIKRCALGLWHGEDCYSAYSPYCHNSYLIDDIHTKPSDGIGDIELAEKMKYVTSDQPIRVCYAGRIEPMKAPLDWVQAIAKTRDSGVDLQATWLGDGSLFREMKSLTADLGLTSLIELSGFERDRDKLLKRIRESHIMLFTHITPESPRCLIEALICGTPIIGYQSKYAETLVKDFGGGLFVPVRDWHQLGELLVTLSKDRQRLSELIKEAAQNGTRFNDEAVFHERSELIRKYLSSGTKSNLVRM